MKPIISLLLLLLVSSCLKKKCTDPNTYLELENFDSNSLSVIKLMQYEQGSNFSKLQTEKTGNIYLKEDRNDTLRYANFRAYIDLNSDYVIYIPATSQTFKITGISIRKEKGERNLLSESDKCSNTVFYRVNDTLKSARGASMSGYPGSARISIYR